MKQLSPQETVDKFWTKFNTKTPGKVSTILSLDAFAQRANTIASHSLPSARNIHASYSEAASNCRAKVVKISQECRRVNQKYRDPHFEIEFDLKWGQRDCLETLPIPNRKKTVFSPKSVKRVGDIFEKPEFFIQGPTANDIRQGRDGDCWLMAALCTLGNKTGLIEKICVARDEQIGIYGFVFYRDGEWILSIIDDKLYLTRPDYDESVTERALWEDRERIDGEEDYRKAYQTGSGALYFAQCEDPNETWLPLLEKAYAKAHGDYAAIEGGFTGEGIEDLTGGVTTELFATDVLDKEYFWKNELLRVNEEFLFGCATGLFRGWGERKGIKESHAYSIMRAVEIDGQRLLLLKNPWGKGEWTGPWSDGSPQWTPEWMQKLDHRFGNDGAFWISYDDLLSKYQTFDRTRLFAEDWKVTQQWANLKIPWTVGYHDTKFTFTLSKPTSVVIVLSQLDTRYFRGLEGQYFFELSFRVHKSGDDDYIVRSHGNYCMSRSVSAELDLEACVYDVLLKIEANRDDTALPVEKVIRDNCRQRRDKLLQRGLSYDLAHAKGQFVETELEIEARETVQKVKERANIRAKLIADKKRKRRNNSERRRRAKDRKHKADAKTFTKSRNEAAKIKLVLISEKEACGPMCDLSAIDGLTVDASAEVFAKDGDKCDLEDGNGVLTSSGDILSPKGSLFVTPTQSDENELVSPTTSRMPNMNVGQSNVIFHEPSFKSTSIVKPDLSSESDDDSSISSVSSAAIDMALAQTKPTPPEACVHVEDGHVCTQQQEDEFEKDPWNAVAVVGLRVYTKSSSGLWDGETEDVVIKVVRPKTWEDGETGLDVDDSAADATREKGDESRKGSVMGWRGRLGSVAE